MQKSVVVEARGAISGALLPPDVQDLARRLAAMPAADRAALARLFGGALDVEAAD
jgi:hypothetical protein